MANTQFKKGDPIIWDSGFGWDIGVWEKVAYFWNYKHTFIMKTGNSVGQANSGTDRQVMPYTQENVDRMYKTYGYVKTANGYNLQPTTYNLQPTTYNLQPTCLNSMK